MKKLFLWGTLALLLASCSGKLTLNDYTIVIPNQATETETRAATELQRYLKTISDCELPIVRDTAAAIDHEILIGGTNRATYAQLDSLGPDGFAIRTLGPKLAIQGGPRKGTLYGVYALLEDYFGVRHYTPQAETVPRKARLTLPATLNDIQVPVFTERYVSGLPLDTLTNDWLRLSQTPDGERDNWGLFVHTFDILLPHELYETHPEYFALVKGRRSKTQPCLSNPAVLEIICQNLAKEIAKNPDAQYWSVSSNDNFQYCQCEHCAAIDAEEGSPAGSVIRFVNQVAERFPDKTISTLGYQYTRKAPKTKPAPNVNIMFCSIECNRAMPIAEDSTSADFCRDMEDWARLTDNIFMWDYAVSFNELQRPFPNWYVLQPNIQYFASHGVKTFFEQCCGIQGGELCEMRSYVVSKLLWDPYQDFDALMNEFLNGYYGQGGPYIRQYIDLICHNMQESGQWLGLHRYAAEYADTWLSADKMEQYLALMDQAVEATADDPEIQTRVKIARKSLYFGGFLEEKDGKWQAKQEWLDRLDEFTELCKKQGVWRVTEHHSTPDEYRNQMLYMAQVQQEGNLAYRKPVTSNVPVSEKRDGQGQGLPLLTDGLHGTQIWITQWLGFYQPTVELTVDLEKVETVRHVDSHHLQILWESAFLPERIEAFTSIDGQHFSQAGQAVTHTVTKDPFFGTKLYTFDFEPRQARYVKLKINSMDICPVWHYYSGDDALMFIDEIVVR